MSLLPAPVAKLLTRWASEEEAALRQMTERKTVGNRMAGYARSERVEAKFLLVALAPFCLVLVLKELGAAEEALAVGLGLSGIWAAIVLAFCFAALWRAFRRSLKPPR